MKKIFFILFLFPLLLKAQPTFFGVASTPADNGTNTATTTAVTVPGSMVTGDLAILIAYQRGSATMSVSATGGQTWTAGTYKASGTATLAAQVFFCTYNGTWGTNPSILFSAGTNTNVVMLVFRPVASTSTWGLDAGTGGTFNSFDDLTGTTFPIGIVRFVNGNTPPLNPNTVSLGIWMTDDDNTWGTLTGTGWSKTSLTAQYRNTSGNDISSTIAYLLLGAAANIPQPAQTQLTLGGDPGLTGGYVFYEIPAATPHSRRITIIQKP